MFKKYLKFVPALALAVVASSANAIDFDLTDPDDRSGVLLHSWMWWHYEDPYYAMEYEYSDDSGEDITLLVTGWSYDSSYEITPDYIGSFFDYGVGVEISNSPNHAIDNAMGDYDMVLLSFSEEVSLDEVSIGWRGTWWGGADEDNSEASIMAYTGDAAAAGTFEGKEWSDLLDEGWEALDDIAIADLNSGEAVDSQGITSKYWLVGAYNASLNGADSDFSAGNDFFKLAGVVVSQVNAVPLPGSLLMFGLALFGFGAVRRKKQLA